MATDCEPRRPVSAHGDQWTRTDTRLMGAAAAIDTLTELLLKTIGQLAALTLRVEQAEEREEVAIEALERSAQAPSGSAGRGHTPDQQGDCARVQSQRCAGELTIDMSEGPGRHRMVSTTK